METNYAGFWPRVAAAIIDNLIFTIPLGIIIWFDISGTVAAILYLLYFAGFESSKKQATPGKQVMNLRVADQHGNRISFWRALARAGLKLGIIPIVFVRSMFIICAIFFPNLSDENMVTLTAFTSLAASILNCLFICWTSKKQALHDLFCGSIVYKHDKRLEHRQTKEDDELSLNPTALG